MRIVLILVQRAGSSRELLPFFSLPVGFALATRVSCPVCFIVWDVDGVIPSPISTLPSLFPFKTWITRTLLLHHAQVARHRFPYAGQLNLVIPKVAKVRHMPRVLVQTCELPRSASPRTIRTNCAAQVHLHLSPWQLTPHGYMERVAAVQSFLAYLLCLCRREL